MKPSPSHPFPESLALMRGILIACAVLGVAGCAGSAPPKTLARPAENPAVLEERCLHGSRAATQGSQPLEACSALIEASAPGSAGQVAALKMRARLYATRGRYADAARDANTLMRLGVQDFTTLKSRADAYRLLGNCQLAVAEYDRLIRLYPKASSAYGGRGDADACLKNHREAVADYARAIALSPRTAALYTRRAGLEAKLLADAAPDTVGEPTPAPPAEPRLATDVTTRAEPDGDPAPAEDDTPQAGSDSASADASTRQGNEAMASHQYQAAVAAFGRALAVNPRLSAALDGRGLAYARLGDYDRAMADFDAALALDPVLQSALCHRADLAGQEGHFIAAIADYTAALSAEPRSVRLLTRRARAYASRGQYDLALLDFQHALALDPKNEQAANGRRVALLERSKQAAARLISIESSMTPAHKPGA
jgi:tetratricopeptide (TPR) repeat protein